jgi:hypothetical protein
VLSDATTQFAAAGLEFPPITAALGPRLRRVGQWCFATEDVDEAAMYLFERYPMAALTTDPSPYFAVSHGGHGVNSYALSFHLAIPGLTLVTQYGWGGGYMDNEAAAARISEVYRRFSALVSALADRQVLGRRLVLIESDIRGVGAWEWLTTPLDESGARAFLAQNVAAPVEEALASVDD